MLNLFWIERNSVAVSPFANYTDRATAACRRSYCQLLRIEGVAWSAQRIPTAVNIGFQDRCHYFSIQVAPQLSSRGWVDPVPDPLLHRKSGSAGNRTRDLWICSRELWPLDHRGGPIYQNSVLTSQEKYYVPATKINRLMPFNEKFALNCENHTKHINTLCERNAELHSMLERVVQREQFRAVCVALQLCLLLLKPYMMFITNLVLCLSAS
jgi:hypothetical protein